MEISEYARMHALETQYWWFVGRRAIIGDLLSWQSSHLSAPQILDIGCGTGANLPMLRQFAGEHGRIAAIDFSPHALQFARTHPSAKQVSLLQGDALHLPFADASFDIVTMFDVLEHLPDDRRALSEVHRVLKPGGRYVWSVPAYQHLWSAHDTALHHFRRYEHDGLRRLLLQSGFGIGRLSFAMSLMPPIAWLWRKLMLPFVPRRPLDATRHSQGAILPSVPPAFNAILVQYLKMEGRIIPRRPLKFGTSLVGVAIKSGRKNEG